MAENLVTTTLSPSRQQLRSNQLSGQVSKPLVPVRRVVRAVNDLFEMILITLMLVPAVVSIV
jgi:hypothetical protein